MHSHMLRMLLPHTDAVQGFATSQLDSICFFRLGDTPTSAYKKHVPYKHPHRM
jgi:hypothetical protein